MKFQKLCMLALAMVFVTRCHAVHFKRLPVPLLSGTVPAGKFEGGNLYIDIDQTEMFTHRSFKEEIEGKEKERIHALFALVTTKDDTAKQIYNFYAAAGLNISLFGTPPFSKKRYALPATDFKDPSNKNIILNEIYYFIIDGIGKEFELIGTDYEIWHSKKQQLILNFLLADQGLAPAQNNLGFFYFEGKSVPKDIGKAVKFLQMAAEQDDTKAQYNLGVLYEKGNGVPKDIGKAVKFLQMAAEKNHAGAQLGLSIFYGKGEGVPRDLVKAEALLRKAVAQGHELAKKTLQMMLQESSKKRKERDLEDPEESEETIHPSKKEREGEEK